MISPRYSPPSQRTARPIRDAAMEYKAKRAGNQVAQRLARGWAAYRDKPEDFARDAFGIELWEGQLAVLAALREHDRIAVRSGHKIGKSTTMAVIALWWFATRPGARVVLTSATARQVKIVLWREIKRLLRQARRPLPISGRIAEDPATGLKGPEDRELFGFSTDEPEKFAGISGAGLAVLVDEASGVKEEIFDAIMGNAAGGALIVLTGNPTQVSGTFYDAFHAQRELWSCIHVSSEETPNVKQGRTVIPGLATAAWVEERRRAWAPHDQHPLYAVRVRGEFPTQATNTVIPLASVSYALARWEPLTPQQAAGLGRLRVGVDVARFGDDDSVMQVLRGDYAFPSENLGKGDGLQIAAAVLRSIARYRLDPAEVVEVKVDVIGVGASVFDQLAMAAQLHRLYVLGINSSHSAEAVGEDGLLNVRAVLWFHCGDWLKHHGALPPDPRLEAELVAPVYQFQMGSGRVKVEEKDAIKARLKRSPDRADALCLAVYRPPPERRPAPGPNPAGRISVV